MNKPKQYITEVPFRYDEASVVSRKTILLLT